MSTLKAEHPIKKIKESAHRAVVAEIVPTPVHHYRAVLFQGALIVIACAFAALTFLVKITPSFATDLQVTKAIQLIDFPEFGWLMTAVSWAGFGPQVSIITGLIIFLIFALGLRWETVMAFFAAAFSTGVNVLVKDLVQRPRPTAQLVNVIDTLNSYSFPSGHVMYYVGFLGFIGFLVFTLLKPSLKRSFLMVLIGVPIALIGISRIYLGEHWASDVLGAYLLGSLTLVTIVQVYIWGKKRFFIHQPVAAAVPQKA